MWHFDLTVLVLWSDLRNLDRNFFVCLLVFVGFYFPNNQPSSDLRLASISETAGTWPYAVLALLWAYFPLVLLVNQSFSMYWRTAGPLACEAAIEPFLKKAVGMEHVSCNQWLFLSEVLSKMEVFYGNSVCVLCVTTCTRNNYVGVRCRWQHLFGKWRLNDLCWKEC